MDIIPHQIYASSLILFGFTLLLGMIASSLSSRFSYIPKVSAYIFIGYLIGPGCLNIISAQKLSSANLFVNISLGLILFEIGRHLDFRWLRCDQSIVKMAAAESMICFLSITAFAHIIGISWLESAFAGAISIATAPAVVLMISSDISAQGPLTRRLHILTSLNNGASIIVEVNYLCYFSVYNV